jgi:glucokinase
MREKLAIAIDIGATKIQSALISEKGKIIEKIKEETKKEGKSGKIITEQIISQVKRLIKKEYRILGIGIGAIGPIDYKRGEIINTANLPFKKIPLLYPLKKTFGVSVFLLNDCNAAVLGEKYFGAGKETENLVYVTISSGIGGGAIINGKLILGKGGNAMEVGHMIVETKYNLLCSCKKGRGHWEGYCSGNNLPKFFSFWLKERKIKIDRFPKKAKEIFEMAKKRNKMAKEFLLEEVGKINAKGISNLIVSFDPELITLGGAVALNNPEFILPPIQKYIDRFLPYFPKIKITPLKEDIVLYGAAAFVFYKNF